jgi:hypothetical protein
MPLEGNVELTQSGFREVPSHKLAFSIKTRDTRYHDSLEPHTANKLITNCAPYPNFCPCDLFISSFNALASVALFLAASLAFSLIKASSSAAASQTAVVSSIPSRDSSPTYLVCLISSTPSTCRRNGRNLLVSVVDFPRIVFGALDCIAGEDQ